MIGVTGTYIADSEDGFTSIKIKPSIFYSGEDNYSYPILTYSYKTKAVSVFGVISKVEISDTPLQQWIGTNEPINILDKIKDTRTSVSSLEMIRFKKKDLGSVYIDCDSPQHFNINKEYLYYADENLTEEINMNKLSKVSLYQLRCKSSMYNNNTAPYLNYVLDGNTKLIYAITDDIFKAILNEDSEIDLTEIEKFEVQDVTLVSSLKINLGVIAEISYSKQISGYYFEEDNIHARDFEEALTSYKESLQDFNDVFDSYSSSIGKMTDEQIQEYNQSLEDYLEQNKIRYDNVINTLDSAIAEYKEHNGLE